MKGIGNQSLWQKINQKVRNLGRRQTPARLDIAILKEWIFPWKPCPEKKNNEDLPIFHA